MPFDYMKHEALSKEKYEVREQINNFAKLGPKMRAYVLTSVEYYSVKNHLKSLVDDFYAGTSCYQRVMGIRLTVPLLKKDGNLQEIENLDKRVVEIERLIDEERQKEAIRLTKSKRAQEELRAPLAKQSLLFAMSAEKSLMSEQLVFVGPCWGKEFSDAFVNTMGYEKLPEQRETIGLALSQLRFGSANGF
jgi:hypothetical protein